MSSREVHLLYCPHPRCLHIRTCLQLMLASAMHTWMSKCPCSLNHLQHDVHVSADLGCHTKPVLLKSLLPTNHVPAAGHLQGSALGCARELFAKRQQLLPLTALRRWRCQRVTTAPARQQCASGRGQRLRLLRVHPSEARGSGAAAGAAAMVAVAAQGRAVVLLLEQAMPARKATPPPHPACWCAVDCSTVEQCSWGTGRASVALCGLAACQVQGAARYQLLHG
jgi:hypothetical protein